MMWSVLLAWIKKQTEMFFEGKSSIASHTWSSIEAHQIVKVPIDELRLVQVEDRGYCCLHCETPLVPVSRYDVIFDETKYLYLEKTILYGIALNPIDTEELVHSSAFFFDSFPSQFVPIDLNQKVSLCDLMSSPPIPLNHLLHAFLYETLPKDIIHLIDAYGTMYQIYFDTFSFSDNFKVYVNRYSILHVGKPRKGFIKISWSGSKLYIYPPFEAIIYRNTHIEDNPKYCECTMVSE